MIEKEQREAERRPITKITHKGEIEIENQEPLKAPDAIELAVNNNNKKATKVYCNKQASQCVGKHCCRHPLEHAHTRKYAHTHA